MSIDTLKMSFLNVQATFLFLLCPIFGEIPKQGMDKLVDLFLAIDDGHGMDNSWYGYNMDNDFFADPKVMYGSLFKSVLNDPKANLISETRLIKIKTYSRFLKQLSSYKRVTNNDLLQMTKTQGRSNQKRSLKFRSGNANENSPKSKAENAWSLLNKLFDEN